MAPTTQEAQDPTFALPKERGRSVAKIMMYCSTTRKFKPWDGGKAEAFYGLRLYTTKAGAQVRSPTYWFKDSSKHGCGRCRGKPYGCSGCAARNGCCSTYRWGKGIPVR